MAKNYQLESKALKTSIVSLVSFSLVGILFGTLLSSEVIFFDGVFSLIGVVTSLITFQISRFIHKADHFNFPFGKETLEPVMVFIQYLILSGFLLYTLYDAIHMILAGGNVVEVKSVIVYLAISTTVLYFVVRRMRKIAKNSHSTLIDSELLQWEISMKQSLWTLGSYIASQILMWLSVDKILPYVDPVILIIFILLTATTVVKEMIFSFKEVIGMKTVSNQLQQEIEAKVKNIVKKYHIKDFYLRVKKVGSLVVIEVDFLVDKEFQFGSVYHQDEIREAFEKSLKNIEYDLWLSIAFTTQYKWIT